MSTVRRYRKRPVVVEAMQFVLGETTKRAVLDFCPSANIGVLITDRDADPLGLESTDIRWLVITTLEGDMDVTDGDWIIRGIEGEFYPVKPSVFAATYDLEDA